MEQYEHFDILDFLDTEERIENYLKYVRAEGDFDDIASAERIAREARKRLAKLKEDTSK